MWSHIDKSNSWRSASQLVDERIWENDDRIGIFYVLSSNWTWEGKTSHYLTKLASFQLGWWGWRLRFCRYKSDQQWIPEGDGLYKMPTQGQIRPRITKSKIRLYQVFGDLEAIFIIRKMRRFRKNRNKVLATSSDDTWWSQVGGWGLELWQLWSAMIQIRSYYVLF